MGTRPEIIKMAPVYFELKKNGINTILLHTGQHTDMASSLYELFGMTPDFSINIERAAPSANDNTHSKICELSQLSSLLLQTISTIIMAVKPSAVLVHGDTSSALMAGMAAFYQQCPVAHVEAGLRSHNEYNPFPEEKNRVLLGQLAYWHFAPTLRAQENLLAGGINKAHIHVVGNTIVEASHLGISKLAKYRSGYQSALPDLVEKLSRHLPMKKLVLVTMHRRENQAENIKLIAQAVLELMHIHPDVCIVWPVHPNPKVAAAVYEVFQDTSDDISARLYITKPLSYPVLLWILKKSWLVLTDSGGIQEEAATLNIPIMVLRDTTERPEIIESGAGMLIGTKQKDILSEVDRLNNNPVRYASMCKPKNLFGDGTAAKRICKVLLGQGNVERKYA